MKEVLFLMIVLMLVATGAARAKSEFFIGQWCGPTEFTQQRFTEVAGANFTVAMIGGDTPETNKQALDFCQTCGIKGLVIDSRIQLRSRYSRRSSGNLDAVLADYSKHPALWGYYIVDEPSSSRFNGIGNVSRYLLGKDPKRIPFVNLFPTYATNKQLGAFSYEQHIDEFCRVVQPKLISYDHYALMADGSVRPDYFANLEIVRRQSIKHAIPFSFILLSVPHGPYKDVTEADIRWQAFTALAYGARGIMYFTYMTPNDPAWGYHDAIIGSSGKPSAKYEIAKRINGEIRKLGPTLLRLKTVAVYHTAPVPDGSKLLPEDGLISGIKGGQFVIGQFDSDDGLRYAMIVNRSLTLPARATIAFSQKVDLREVSPASGRERAAIVSDRDGTCVWNAAFAPGQGRLVRIDTVDNLPVLSWEDPIRFRPRVMLDPSNQFGNRIFDPNKEELYNEGMNMYQIALNVQKYLQADGRVDAFVTRNTQTQRTSLGRETQLCRALNCDILYSLHSDATGTSDPGGGSWTFFAGDEGKKLADTVQAELISAMKSTFYPDVKNMGTRTHWYRLWVLHEGGCQGALTEFLFHTNPKEREMLKNAANQEIMAQAAARGILKYLGFEP